MKNLGIFGAIVAVGAAVGTVIYKTLCGKKKEESKVCECNSTVEALIKKDQAYFDNMAGNIIFYESQVVLDKPFNESDKFVAVQVTNVFQQSFEGKDGDVTSNIYEFKHVINYGDYDVLVHKNAMWMEDKPVNMNVIKLNFDEAYTRAKESDLVPVKSCFMVLRNPLGPVNCDPCYFIGNKRSGIMYVGAVDGKVSDINPAFDRN